MVFGYPRMPAHRHTLNNGGRLAAVLVAAVVGFLFAAGAGWSYRRNIRAGANDFLQLYAGARLVGSPGLYMPERVRDVQLAAAGTTGRFLVFNRLPWYAAALKPLAWFPYRRAWLVWGFLQVLFFAVFLALWPYPRTLQFSLLSLPAYLSLMEGQDTALLLACIGIVAALYRRGRPFAAGAVFSFCSIKPHFFLLLPVFLVSRYAGLPGLPRTGAASAEAGSDQTNSAPAQKRALRWFIMGLVAAGGALLVVSFLADGIDWPVRYFQMLASHADPQVDHMPTLAGAFARWPAGWPLKWALIILVAAAVWVAASHLSLEAGLGVVLAAGILVSPHAYTHDCALLLPGCAALYKEHPNYWLRALVLALQAPVLYVLIIVSAIGPAAVSALLLTLLAIVAWRSRPVAPSQRLALVPTAD